MKRSEFIVRVNSARDPMAEAAVAAAEAAGVKWDPEGPPMPGRLDNTPDDLPMDRVRDFKACLLAILDSKEQP